MANGRSKDGHEAVAYLVTLMPKPLLIMTWLAITIPTPAQADLDSLKRSCMPKHAVTTPAGPALPYTFCDDGLPPVGGRVPNIGAVNAVAVPEKYNGFAGLPAKVLPPDRNSGADQNGDIALDVDVSIPIPRWHRQPAGIL